MNKFISKTALAVVLAAASLAANAASYTFSYTVNGFNGLNTTVTGSFDGSDINGGLITSLTNIKAAIGGVDVDGGNYLDNFAQVGSAGAAVVSVDGSANNFLFNSISGQNVSYYLSTAGANSSSQNYLGTGSSWTVTAVPEPATYAMLLGGMGLLAGIARRRNSGDRA